MATVKRTLATHAMFAPGDRVLVGVSGGPDSMALLHLLSQMIHELAIHLAVAHLNHCLRGASADRDADAVYRTAAALGYRCHMGRAHVIKVKRQLGLSLEDAARRVRYAFFNKVMVEGAYNKLALGHHMDDNAEQMLMVLLRGTGPRGLAGIAPVRENRIVRPLINARRSQIEAYVDANAIPCVRDASNDDPRFLRNRIRHALLPLLASDYNPRIEEHLIRLADVMRTEEAWIGELTAEHYPETKLNHDRDRVTLSVDALRQHHPALIRRLVRLALKDLTGSLQRIGFSHVQAVVGLLADGGDGKECHLPGGIRVCRSGNRLLLLVTSGRRRGIPPPAIEKAAATLEVVHGPFPATVQVESLGIGLRFVIIKRHQLSRWSDVGPNRAYLDLDRLALPLTVRSPQCGDCFRPLGTGGTQKLTKFFIDHRIPRPNRTNVPVLTDTRGIVWLVGQRIDDRVKVSSETSQVLRVEFFLLDTR